MSDDYTDANSSSPERKKDIKEIAE